MVGKHGQFITPELCDLKMSVEDFHNNRQEEFTQMEAKTTALKNKMPSHSLADGTKDFLARITIIDIQN